MRMRIALLSCYELGHQPMGLASPLGFLKRAGIEASALDLAVEPFDAERIAKATFIGISVPMHTALRLGLVVLERARRLNPSCHVCFYGLYASLQEDLLFDRGADSVIGGEYEEALVKLIGAREAETIEGVSRPHDRQKPRITRLPFALPERETLRSLDRYAKLQEGGATRLAGHVEATRGCLHRCTHCPITPVYNGRFFAVPEAIVAEDIRRQVALGATHVSFGDPDFLNGPMHALRVTRAMKREHPEVTFDCTVKVEHILKHRALFPELRELGCLFVVSAFESLSDRVLIHLDKGHKAEDLSTALAITRDADLSLRPTWVPFTPWTGIEDFLALLDFVEREGLIENIAPVQYGIRLLVPPGSVLASHPAMAPFLGPFDPAALSFTWTDPDPRVTTLQAAIASAASDAETREEDVETTFATMKRIALRAAGQTRELAKTRVREKRPPPPRLTESWFC